MKVYCKPAAKLVITDKTKLKLDREVGGGDLFLNCDIDLLA